MASTAQLSDAELRYLAASASSLRERLKSDGRFVPAEDSAGETEAAAASAALVLARLEGWRELAAAGDAARLGRRLAWAGWEEPRVRQALSGVRLAEGAELPAWVLLVREFSNAAQQAEGRRQVSAPDPAAVPFAPLLQPLLSVAQRRLAIATAGSSAATILSAEAARAVEAALLRRLGELGFETLYAEFTALRAARIAAEGPSGRRGSYAAFITGQLADGLRGVLLGYPVLARLFATAVAQWVQASAELLFRIAESYQALLGSFPALGLSQPPAGALSPPATGCVVGVEMALSDPHHDGRTVAVLTFAGGGRVVYKPKRLALEAAFTELLRFCNDRGKRLPLAAPRVLDRGDYGFVEFIAQEPCADEEAVRRYYQRSGMLLCLLYVLDGTDAHEDNLIAHGELPMPIDLETLLHHRARDLVAPWSLAQLQAQLQLASSVLSTGLLPVWKSERGGRIKYDGGGLSGGEGGTRYQAPVLLDRNSDEMELGERELVTRAHKNRVYLGPRDGAVQSVREPGPKQALLLGFTEMFRFLLQERDALLSKAGPLSAFCGVPTRFVFRATQVYSTVLERSLDPALLRDGVDRSLFLEVLASAYLQAAQRPAIFPLLDAELAALERLDVPHFVVPTDSDALPLPDGSVPAYFQQASYPAVCERLAALCEKDLAAQMERMQTALYTLPSGEAPRGPRLSPGDFPQAPCELEEKAAEAQAIWALRAGAARIARELGDRAVQGKDGTATWLGVTLVSDMQRYQHEPLPMYLGNGVAGVALFLAAQAKQAGDRALLALRQAASLHLRKWLRSAEAQAAIRDGSLELGALTGSGSLLYALVRTAELSGDAELYEDALAVLGALLPERIAQDRALDITAGAAGTLLGLLALYQATGNQVALGHAVRCGVHLIASQVEGQAGGGGWPFFTGGRHFAPLTGFSHGAAGIAYALFRLHAVTGDDRFGRAARSGLAYERALEDPAGGNWPDLRPTAQERFACSWCHGAPGIGLSRLGMLACAGAWESSERPAFEREIEAALKTNGHEPWDGIDHVCCGNFGRLELLLQAGLRLERPALLTQARRLACALLARAERTSGFYLYPGHPPYLYNPGFFQGTAGIGYQLLRLAAPREFAAVLLFE